MNITVYCGANMGGNPVHKQAVQDVADWIVRKGHTLVYGGSHVGLMGKLADAVLAQGGQVLGVMPRFLSEREAPHHGLTQLFEVETMSERKLKMFELGEAFIALPGGLGTLEEISELISWARIGQNPHPCVFFDADGFYQPLKKFLQHMSDEGFVSQTDLNKILFSNNLAKIETFIQDYTPPNVRTY